MAAASGELAATAAPAAAPGRASDAEDGAVTVTVVKALTGDVLARLEGVGEDATAEDLAARLPAVGEGSRYQFLADDRPFPSSTTLSATFFGQREVALQAVVSRYFGTQQEMNTKLIAAAAALDQEAVEDLLAAGASAKYLDDPEGVWGACDAKTALHAALEAGVGGEGEDAAERQRRWRGIINSLLEAKADVNAVRRQSDWRGCGSSRTAFQLALRRGLREDGDVELLDKFLACGADPNSTDVRNTHSMRTDGRSATPLLYTAVASGNVAFVRSLLRHGARVDELETKEYHNERNYNQHSIATSLHAAIEGNAVELAVLLLRHGASPNSTREQTRHVDVQISNPDADDDPRAANYEPRVKCVQVKYTPLHLAISAGSPALVALLRCLGAEAATPARVGEEETTTEALCGGQEALVEALAAAEWGPRWAELLPAAAREDAEMAVAARRL